MPNLATFTATFYNVFCRLVAVDFAGFMSADATRKLLETLVVRLGLSLITSALT